MSEAMQCQGCGAMFVRKADERQGKFAKRRYCSRACSAVVGGKAPKPPKPTPDLRQVIRDRSVVDLETRCWNWLSTKTRQGYGRVRAGGQRLKVASRVSYEAFVGNIPEGVMVCHRCDNPSCVNADHLFLGTQADNIRDMISKGRRGSAAAKLTPDQVAEIRASSERTGILARREPEPSQRNTRKGAGE